MTERFDAFTAPRDAEDVLKIVKTKVWEQLAAREWRAIKPTFDLIRLPRSVFDKCRMAWDQVDPDFRPNYVGRGGPRWLLFEMPVEPYDGQEIQLLNEAEWYASPPELPKQ